MTESTKQIIFQTKEKHRKYTYNIRFFQIIQILS